MLEYDIVRSATAEEYLLRMQSGWRRFGHALFRPVCRGCQECKSLRIPVQTFKPNRSQRRCLQANADVQLEIGEPRITPEHLDLYHRYHAFQTDHKGWSWHPKNVHAYAESFVLNPFPTQEWRYYLGHELIGIGYVDALGEGLSAIYFFYAPEYRERSLGTLNVLRAIAVAAERDLPYLYLGYYVDGCRSLEYKANFTPNEVLDPEGEWTPFRVK